MIPEGTFSAFHDDHITVTRTEGKRTEDGYKETSTVTVLSAAGDAQQITRSGAGTPAHFEAGDLLFFASGSVEDVEVGDSATVNDLEATVEEVVLMDNSLVLSIDG